MTRQEATLEIMLFSMKAMKYNSFLVFVITEQIYNSMLPTQWIQFLEIKCILLYSFHSDSRTVFDTLWFCFLFAQNYL